jgi:hypothetical protein
MAEITMTPGYDRDRAEGEALFIELGSDPVSALTLENMHRWYSHPQDRAEERQMAESGIVVDAIDAREIAQERMAAGSGAGR